MTKRKIGHDYRYLMNSGIYKTFITLPKPKKKPGRPRKDDRKIISGIFMSFVLAVNGKYCHDFMERQAPYMIDFRNGKKRDYLRKCGKLV